MWIQTGVTVRKRSSGVVTSVTLTFDLWPWPFAWTLPWSVVITPENFMMIRWWEHSQKGVTDRQTDRQTENTIHRAAWSQLKTLGHMAENKCGYQMHIFVTSLSSQHSPVWWCFCMVQPLRQPFRPKCTNRILQMHHQNLVVPPESGVQPQNPVCTYSVIEEVPYCLSRSSIKFQDHTGQKKLLILTRIERFRAVTPMWIHRWLWNGAQSLT